MLEVDEMWKTRESKKLKQGDKKAWKMRGAYMDKREETMPGQSEDTSAPSDKRSTYWMRELEKAEQEHGDRYVF